MNRRNFVASTGAVALGGGVSVNALSRSALAFQAKISNNTSIPEDVNDPTINLQFDSFEVTASNIEDVTITLNAEVENNGMVENVDSVSKTLNNSNGSNDLSNISLTLSENSTNDGIDLESVLSGKNSDDKLNLTVEIVVENDKAGRVSTGSKEIIISITTPNIKIDTFEETIGSNANNWAVNRGNSITISDNYAVNGSRSAHLNSDRNDNRRNFVKDIGFASPDEIQWHYRESSSGIGVTYNLFNSNGEHILATLTANPDYGYISKNTTSGFNTYTSYDDWKKFTISFDWDNNVCDITWDDIGGSDSSETATNVEFKNPSDGISEVALGGEPTWSGAGNALIRGGTWVDDVYIGGG